MDTLQSFKCNVLFGLRSAHKYRLQYPDNLISLSISQHPVITGAPQIKDASALQARTIGPQLKGSKKGAGKKGKGGKESTSSSQPAKESSESNPHTKALVGGDEGEGDRRVSCRYL